MRGLEKAVLDKMFRMLLLLLCETLTMVVGPEPVQQVGERITKLYHTLCWNGDLRPHVVPGHRLRNLQEKQPATPDRGRSTLINMIRDTNLPNY